MEYLMKRLPGCCRGCGLLAYRERQYRAVYWCRNNMPFPSEGTCGAYKYRRHSLEHLIEALQILLKYDNPEYPVSSHCDVMYVRGNIHPDTVSDTDLRKLDWLGFSYDEESTCFLSYCYG